MSFYIKPYLIVVAAVIVTHIACTKDYFNPLAGFERDNYALIVTTTHTPVTADAYEPDGSYGEAHSMISNTPQTHTLTANDTDFIKFTATAGQSYTIKASSAVYAYMYLYSANSTSHIEYDYGNTLSIQWSCYTSGTYYIRIAGRSVSAAGGYSVSYTQ